MTVDQLVKSLEKYRGDLSIKVVDAHRPNTRAIRGIELRQLVIFNGTDDKEDLADVIVLHTDAT